MTVLPIRFLRARLLVCTILFFPSLATAGDPLAGLDDYVAKAMKEHDVPGVGLAIVKDGKVIMAKGYGVRTLGQSAPVDENTIFAIGSCTKAFTAAGLALLVDEGKIKWDDKACDHLPEFRMNDQYVADQITVRDLLAHRCGLVRHDMMWYRSPYSRAELIKRFRLIKPDYSFRSKFSYQNGMYLVAGELCAAVAKTDWDKYIAERLFKPLGMTASSTSTRDLSAGGNVASPHDKVADKWAPVPWVNIDNVAPAGSISSSVADMAKWIQFQLGDGTVGDKRLLTSGSLKQMQSAQTVMPVEGLFAKLNPEAHLMSYGLGWMLSDYRGKKVVEHGGNIDGMSAQVGLLPEEKLGLVVLTNRDGNFLPRAVMRHIFDRVLDAPAHDWSAEMLKVEKFVQDIPKQREKSEEEKHVKDTKPSLALEKYAGEYKDALHGPLEVKATDGKLTATQHGLTYDLEHWHYDTFRAARQDKRGDKVLVQFLLGKDGEVAGLTSEITEDESITMKRSAKSETKTVKLSEDEMKKFVGKYESKVPPIDLDVEFVAGKLRVVIGGGQSAAMEAVKADRFKVAGDGGEAFLQFDLDGDTVKSLSVEQDKVKIKFEKKK